MEPRNSDLACLDSLDADLGGSSPGRDFVIRLSGLEKGQNIWSCVFFFLKIMWIPPIQRFLVPAECNAFFFFLTYLFKRRNYRDKSSLPIDLSPARARAEPTETTTINYYYFPSFFYLTFTLYVLFFFVFIPGEAFNSILCLLLLSFLAQNGGRGGDFFIISVHNP